MKVSSAWSFHVLAFCAGTVLLSSCSSPSATAGSPSALEPASAADARLSLLRSLTSVAVVPPKAVHPDRRKSWVSPNVDGLPRLAFASDDGYNDIFIFSLPDFKLKGTLTGYSEPQGMCSDQGNVWVTNTGTEQIFELSRAGKQIATLTDHLGYPVGCAVDKSGDLAVTDIFGFSGQGQILFYNGATGTPTPLENPNGYYYYFAAFDPNGNLYVSGKSSAGSYMLSECAAGKTSCSTITISGGTIYFPGFVQWYRPGNYLAAADQLCGDTEAACIYWIKISGSKGKITGKTTLSNPSGGQTCDVVQAELDPVFEKNLVAGDYEYCGFASTSEARWLYPAGGEPTNYATSGLSEPIGSAISTK